ncbi:MAG: alpha-2-macroglobulin family protein, partial [Saprospiraceae bacterium]
GKGRTDSKGMAQLERLSGKPYIIAGVRGDHRGFLRLADGASLPLSRFEVDGVAAAKGLKGYLYGERGVWRPGDSLYLNFVLEDRDGNVPANHPLTFELRDARGALRHRVVLTQHVGGIYPMHCATDADAPTGSWTAKVMAGGAVFTKTLRVETVKPNRLKLDLDFGKKALYAADGRTVGRLQVKWLHGAAAQNLKAQVEMQLAAVKTTFEGLRNFVFDDPARDFYSEPQVAFDGYIDAEGRANIPLEIDALNDQAPGKLCANFRVRAFESGGDFSTDYFTLDYFPYSAYVGVAIPVSDKGEKTIDSNGGVVQFALVDARGKPLANREVLVGLYRTDWRWWWEDGAQSGVYQYRSTEHRNALQTATLRTNAQGIATWKVKPQGWGRYLVRASDPLGGHAAGDFFWSGYPRQTSDMHGRHAAAMLTFSSDKKSYQIGEEVTLNIPGGERSQILLTLENGSKVIERRWYEAQAGDNQIRFKTQAAMAPAVYAHVTLIQPYANTANDLPIRMYGVIPIEVLNPASRLQPRITAPDAVKPDESFEVKISEATGKACAYTLAIVDEGLLDLTRFKTPDPNEVFNAREALRIKTWDMYDHVIGAYGAELERLLSTGGDGINTKARNNAQANRYKPAVRHLGPFRLDKGKTATHKIKIDNYVGSVRVMAVCAAPNPGGEGAYGSADKTMAVRKALMVQATLPRVIAPGETLRLPVEVFAMEKKIQNARVQLKAEGGKLRISDPSTLSFSQPGSKIAYFDVQTGDAEGIVKITAMAQGGGESASHTVEIMVKNPNPDVSEIIAGEIAPGDIWTPIVPTSLFSKIKNAVVELSVLPAINLDRHLDYLIQYPHGCLEQTVSSAFPQLFVSQIAPLNDKQKDQVARHVGTAIEKLRSYQLSDGSFSYWPGASQINNYSNVYAGHFLLEAQKRGYAIPEGMLDDWLAAQIALSSRWSPPKGDGYEAFNSENVQAYRLYALALAGKPDIAGMNRMRERGALYRSNAGLLANAYVLAGKKEAAREALASPQLADWRYEGYGATLGNDLRDKALMLETQILLGDKTRVKQLLEEVCRELGGENSYQWNTQSLAVALRALGRYATDAKGETPITYSYALDGAALKKAESATPIGILPLSDKTGKVAVKNTGSKTLYARLIIRGQARMQQDDGASQNHIALQVRFTDLKGAAIDPARIPRGTDFIAEFTVKRDSELKFAFNQLALTQAFPAGWEIVSGRLSNIAYGASSQAEYQDVRDDRVHTYFGIPDQSGARTYRVQLNAAYPGRFFMPMNVCEAMYDNRIRAALPGRWVEVI